MRHKAYYLPEELEFTGVLNPEIRKRGIYEAVLYDSKIHLSGYFNLPDLTHLNIYDHQIYWDEICLVFSVDDKQGVSGCFLKFLFHGDSLLFQPGFNGSEGLSGGLFCSIGDNPGQRLLCHPKRA